MVSRKATAALAAAALVSLGASSLWAGSDSSSSEPSSYVVDTPQYLAEAAPPRRPLMAGLDAIGLAQPLEKNNIAVYGFVEASWTYNFDNPESGINFGRVFDQDHNDVRLNQADITVEKLVAANGKDFDWGGRMEWIWGSDAGFIHSNGLFDWYDGPRDPDEQWDLNQAYVDLNIPIGNGLLLRGGKFVTLLGQETINPTSNALFSHSYLFNYAIPFTHTGILGTYALNDQWSVSAGITRGWDQATEDNNDAIDFLGQVKWTMSKQTTLIVNLVTGPELPDNNDDYRTVVDLIVSHAVNDQLSVAANGDFGWENDSAADGGTAYWYGLAGYASYKINNYFTLNGRGEWFRDDDGVRTGFSASYYEATIGLAIKPMPNDRWGQYLLIRPELRGDWSTEDVYNDGDDSSMYTFGVDVIYSF